MAESATEARQGACKDRFRLLARSEERRPVLFCCHEPVWPLSGGSTGGNLAILRELKAAGLEPVAVVPFNGSLLRARRAAGVRLAPFRPFRMHRNATLRTVRYALYSILYFFALLGKVRRMKPALLICRNTVLALPVYAVAKLTQIPTAIVLADLLSFFFWNKPTRPPLWQRVFRSFECHLAGLHGRIFVVTPAMADEIEARVGGSVRSRISVTRDGVQERFLALSRADFSEAEQIRESICGQAPLAVFYGTLERHHGMQELVQIVSLLLAAAPDFHALLIGGGPCRSILVGSLLGAHARVHVYDFMDVETLIRHALAADVGMIPYPAVPSTNMIYSFKFLEYRCLGLPIVAFPLETLRREFSNFQGLRLAADCREFVDAVIRFGRTRKRYPPDTDFCRRFAWRQVAAPIVQEAKSRVERTVQRASAMAS